MAVNVLKILRSLVLGNRPSGHAYGEPYVNFAENQFGVINSTGGAQDLIGVTIFSTTATYVAGQAANYGGQLYIALVNITTPGAWNASQWSPVTTAATFFPSGTRLSFFNSAAPTGWTRVTTYDDALMRIVGSATPASGGTNGFVATFNSQTATGAFTQTTSEMATHAHQFLLTIGGSGVYGWYSGAYGANVTYTTQNAGSGGAHSHGITTGIKYVDVLIGNKT